VVLAAGFARDQVWVGPATPIHERAAVFRVAGRSKSNNSHSGEARYCADFLVRLHALAVCRFEILRRCLVQILPTAFGLLAWTMYFRVDRAVVDTLTLCMC
jgi:hypothetical protein